MFQCPHCREPGVTVTGKLFAAPWAPTVCSRCGGRSSEKMMASQLVRGFHGIAPLPVAFIALLYRSWLPLILYLVVASLAHGLILIYAPLYPLSEQELAEKKAGRRTAIALLFAAIALLAGIGLFLEG